MTFFRPEHLTPPLKNELEITVFGPGYGESIILHIPYIGWGVIDSCTKKINKQSVVLPLTYLQEILKPPYPALAFVILTHPHQDHYQGMDRLLTEYPGGIERICRYNGDGVRELKDFLASQYIATGQKPGLSKVFEAFRTAEKNGAQVKRLSEQFYIFNEEHETENKESVKLQMISLSPSAGSQEKYRDILYKSMPKPGKALLPLQDKSHNLLSVAILLSIGDFQILLGSDVEEGKKDKTGWEAIFRNNDLPGISAKFVKIAHHGGKSGFHKEIWESNNQQDTAIGVITPYKKGKNYLPDGVDLLKPFVKQIGLTHTVDYDTNLYKYYSKAVVDRLKLHVKEAAVYKDSDDISYIRTRFDIEGKVTEQVVVPSAKWL
ncbi:hypothetical protein KAJ27_08680 [bacterium]|nr:hypothetical protein [bacterium]